MGYTIIIGEAKFVSSFEYGALYERYEIEGVEDKNAPAFGEPTDFTNERWPSYSAWSEAMNALGIYDLFFNKYDGLMREHPGCEVLTNDVVFKIENAVKKRKKDTGGAVAGFGDNKDPWLVRGEWLLYWCKWAMENCKNPAIKNT